MMGETILIIIKRNNFLWFIGIISGGFIGYKIYQYSTAYQKDCREINDVQIKIIDSLKFIQIGGAINDVSCLNPTPIYGIVRIENIDDIRNAIFYAKKNNLKISIAGARHSMGGQTFSKNVLVLDMLDYKKMKLDQNQKIMTVESGALWHELQYSLHPYNLAIKAMQSSSIFTVGGSISVNAHGMDFRVGSIASTIKSLRIMDSEGIVKTITKESDSQLFNAVVGGYGLFGVIVDADIELTDNVMCAGYREIMDYKDLPDFFLKQIKPNTNYELFYAHLSTEPRSFLKQAVVYTFKKIDYSGQMPPLKEVEKINIRRFIFNISKPSYFGKKFKWFAEKYLDKETELKTCSITATGSNSCLLSRNAIMHDAVEYLRNKLRNKVDILQEYFIPIKNFVPFIDAIHSILRASGIVTLNVSVRVVHKESIMLNYAPETMFAIVLYLNQSTTPRGIERMKILTQQLINTALAYHGTFFLPYQLYYTKEQLIQAYPNIDEFFKLKQKYDPDEIFTNMFYEKYFPL